MDRQINCRGFFNRRIMYNAGMYLILALYIFVSCSLYTLLHEEIYCFPFVCLWKPNVYVVHCVCLNRFVLAYHLNPRIWVSSYSGTTCMVKVDQGRRKRLATSCKGGLSIMRVQPFPFSFYFNSPAKVGRISGGYIEDGRAISGSWCIWYHIHVESFDQSLYLYQSFNWSEKIETGCLRLFHFI